VKHFVKCRRVFESWCPAHRYLIRLFGVYYVQSIQYPTLLFLNQTVGAPKFRLYNLWGDYILSDDTGWQPIIDKAEADFPQEPAYWRWTEPDDLRYPFNFESCRHCFSQSVQNRVDVMVRVDRL